MPNKYFFVASAKPSISELAGCVSKLSMLPRTRMLSADIHRPVSDHHFITSSRIFIDKNSNSIIRKIH